MFKIRQAKIEDLISITDIYNEAIEKSVATFNTTPKTLEEQKKWLTNHGPKNPILVVENKENIIGWASLI